MNAKGRAFSFVAALIVGLLAATSLRAEELLASGPFYDGPYAPQHKVSGTANIVRLDDGGYELRLADFVSDFGPDVVIIVSTAEEPTTDKAIKSSEWVSLGARQSLTGDQTYALPDGVDPKKWHSVGVWCESYSVLFGAAALEQK